mgnify:CR=1 FL=1
MGDKPEFEMGATLRVKRSGEKGTVEAIAEYREGPKYRYWFMYTDGTGCARDAWFYASELEADA